MGNHKIVFVGRLLRKKAKGEFMTREELKALGVADESIDGVMKLHGVSVTEAKNSVTAAFNAEKESMQKELNRYQKGGDLFVDTKEFKRLQEFEQTTLNREITDKKTKGLKSLYTKANASESVAKLLIQSTDLNTIELDEKGEVKNGADILKKAKADYADLFADDGNKGVPQTPTAQNATTSAGNKKVVY
jgi:hypothetical protein